MRRIAVVGSGISGLAAARELEPHARVTLFEAGQYFGGHTHTVDVTLENVTHGVDTGFLVFNERTYPNLIRLFGELGIETVASDMSFSVKAPAGPGRAELDWSGTDLDSLFAQRSNLLRPGFWRMLRDLARFNRLCTELAERNAEGELVQTIGDFLDQHRFSNDFREGYFLPMIACIWSCPTEQMLRFPISTLIRFCHNHGLIQIANRPRWFTVKGGARQYVERIVGALGDARLATPVRSVRRLPPGGGVMIATDAGSERFDEVVLACHSDQALALLADPTERERSVLGAIAYHRNRAVLHTDASLLPRRRRAWAAWNYERAASSGRERSGVCLHYLINKLQPLPFETPVIVSLNPLVAPRAETVLGAYDYAHPVFDQRAIDAQRLLPRIQGRARTWFCGAWTRYGFHEDGLSSGLAVAGALKSQWSLAERAAA